MKKTIILFALAAICAIANAKVLTVSNNANSPGQYTDLQVAVTAAANNDTIYVHGSPIDYGTVTITKPLIVIGAGALPNKTYSYSTKIGNLTLSFNGTFTSSGSGSKILGCELGYLTLGAGNGTTISGVSNVKIERNKISALFFSVQEPIYSLAHNNIIISNNIISSIGGWNNSGQYLIKNTVIKNNLITGQIYNLGHESAGSWIFNNNLVLGSFFLSSRSAVISNNIIYSTGSINAFSKYNEFCTVTNNCFYGAYTYVTSNIIYGTNTGSNNLLNQDPLFVYYESTLGSYTQTYPVSGPFANFNLQAGSPCLLAGSDGLNMGIYGGLSPFLEGYPTNSRYRYFPMPAIPQMLEMNIQNAAILPSGTLNVNFKARKQN